MRHERRWGWLLVAALLLVPQLSGAQPTGGIAGTVKDTSGAVLPGVTVEAASPALIEKVRTVVTDGQGNYKITDLRPGPYTVTFTLAGFAPFKREGISLTSGFTAAANAEMKVGGIEETVTVSGASPIVDIQNTRTQQVMKSETLNQLPGTRSVAAMASLTLGAIPSSAGRNDVGGDKGELSSGILLHGSRGDDGRLNYDGMNTNVFFGNGGGQQRVFVFNSVSIEEVVIDTGTSSAETETGGANMNIVPKDGGNNLSVYGTANFTNSSLSAKAISDALAKRGVQPTASVKHIWDYGVGVGGPIRQDKVWFYTANRWWGAQNNAPGAYFNKSKVWYRYEPDLSRPAYGNDFFVDNAVRFTLQASEKNKFTQEIHLQHGCQCMDSVSATSSPEATQDFQYGPQYLIQTTWSSARTSKLLLQAGATFMLQGVDFSNGSGVSPNYFIGAGKRTIPDLQHVSIKDNLTQMSYNALAGSTDAYGVGDNSNNYNQRFVASYITGSHALKAGIQTIFGIYDTSGMPTTVNPFNYQFYGGIPTTIVQFAGPFVSKTRVSGQGLYVQDQWTMKKLTINLGARFDHFTGRTLAQDIPAGPYVPARQVDEVKGVPNYKDITPRIGVAYDVFGNGKTAVKASFGRYLYGQGGGTTRNIDPATSIVTSTSRTWADANGDFIPQCNLANSAANGECGAFANPSFGSPNPIISYDKGASQGWGNREFNNQFSLQLQQELHPGVGLAVGYFHTSWGNLTALQNLTSSTPDAFNELCVTAPNDPALASAAGTTICGYYAPKSLAAQRFRVTQVTDLGLPSPKEIYNGVDIGVTARFRKGGLVQGGVTVGREGVNQCYANGHPEIRPFSIHGTYVYASNITTFPSYPQSTSNGDTYCNINAPWWRGIGSQAKAQVIYPLPFDFNLSGTFKTLPGIPLVATQFSFDPRGGTLPFGFLPAAILPVGAPGGIGGGASITPFHDDRLYQADLRVTKRVSVGKSKITAMVDVYNALNNRVSQGNLNFVGAAPGQFKFPLAILGGRLFKFGAQVAW